MNLNDRVKNLQDVSDVANKLFPCTVTVDSITGGYGEKSDGTRVVRLIVGWKKNPIYDPNIINPQDKKSNPKAADVRIISITPGITAKELIDFHLTKIQKSLQNKDQVIDNEISSIERQKTAVSIPNDEELAAQLERGGTKAIGDAEWQDDSLMASSWEDEKQTQKSDKSFSDTFMNEPEEEKTDNKIDDILSAVGQLNQNIQTVSSDLSNINKRLEKVEVKKAGRPVIKKQDTNNEDKK